jgi:hypothetical protein
MSLREEAAMLPAIDRARLKVAALASRKIEKFKVDDLLVTVRRQEIGKGSVFPGTEDHDLVIWIEVQKNGKRIKVDNPFIFRNPPILVPDKTGHREDLDEAIRQMLADTLRITLGG